MVKVVAEIPLTIHIAWRAFVIKIVQDCHNDCSNHDSTSINSTQIIAEDLEKDLEKEIEVCRQSHPDPTDPEICLTDTFNGYYGVCLDECYFEHPHYYCDGGVGNCCQDYIFSQYCSDCFCFCYQYCLHHNHHNNPSSPYADACKCIVGY